MEPSLTISKSLWLFLAFVVITIDFQILTAQIELKGKVAPGEVLILPRKPSSPVSKNRYSELEILQQNYDATIKSLSSRYQMELWTVQIGQEESLIETINSSALDLIAMYNIGHALPKTERASFFPNKVKTQPQSTNDPYFNNQYALPLMNVPEAWNISKGSKDVIVVVMDTGIDTSHPDLTDNIWINPGEIAGNGVDDDGNGYIDDINGWDTYRDTGNLRDSNGHGTHVAGIIGAKGNNGIGVSGINQDVSIIGLNVFREDDFTYYSEQVAAFEYIDALLDKNHNIVAVNQSLGSLTESEYVGSFNLEWRRSYSLAHASKNCIWVIAAGNDATDLNDGQFYALPAEVQAPNIITVASSNSSDNLSSFSNYGRRQVEIAAPGTSILSTTPNNGYQYYNGTSMAAPYVAGLIALSASVFPDEDYPARITRIMATGNTTSAFSNSTISGKRINAHLALATDWGNGFYSSSATSFARFKTKDNMVSFSLGLVNQTGSSITMNSYSLTGIDAANFQFEAATSNGTIPSGGAIGFGIKLNKIANKDNYTASILITTNIGTYTLPIEVDTYQEPVAQIELSNYSENLGDISARDIIENDFDVTNSGTAVLNYNLVFELKENQNTKQKVDSITKATSRPYATYHTNEKINIISSLTSEPNFIPHKNTLASAIQNNQNTEWIFETGFESGQGSPGNWLSYHSSGTRWQLSSIDSKFNGYGNGLTTGSPWGRYLDNTFSRAVSPLIDLENQINAGKRLSEIRFDYALELEQGWDILKVDLVDASLNILATLANSESSITNDGKMHTAVIPVSQFNITSNFRLRFTLETDFSIQAGFGAIVDNVKIGVVSVDSDLTIYPSNASVGVGETSNINYRINTRYLTSSNYTFTTNLSSNATNNPQNLGSGNVRYQSIFNSLPLEAPKDVILYSPLNNSTQSTQNTTLLWLNNKIVDTYQLQLSSDSFVSTLLDSALTDTTLNLTNLAYNTSYQWRVKSINSVSESEWSQPWSFTTRIGDVSGVALFNPKNDSSLVPVNPSFKWSSDSNASAYQIQLSTDSFASTFIDQELSDTTFTTTNLAYSTSYQWRVRAKNAYSTSDWSTPSIFTTRPHDVSQVSLISPANNGVTSSITPTLVWKNDINADSFRTQLSNDSFVSILIDSTLTDTTLNLTNLAYNTSYQWRAKSLNSVSESEWSEKSTFTTRLADVTGVELISPITDSLDTPTEVQLVWASDKRAAFYQIQTELIFFAKSDINSISNTPLDTIVTDTTFTLSALPNSVYVLWRVRSLNEYSVSGWTDKWIFSVREADVDIISLLSPENESLIDTKTPTLIFESIKTASSYQLQLSDNQFERVLIDTTLKVEGFNGTQGFQPKILSFNTLYQWRVKAINSVSESEWTEPWTFTTRIGDVSRVVLASPTNNEVLDLIAPTFVWNNETNASSYQLEVSSDNFTSTTISETLSDTNFSGVDLENGRVYQWRVKATNPYSESDWTTYTFEIPVTTSIEENLPTKTELLPNYPNPFNPTTNIAYRLSQSASVSLQVFNLSGELISTVVNQVQNAGSYSVSYNAANLPSGVYLYRLNVDGVVYTRKMLLLK